MGNGIVGCHRQEIPPHDLFDISPQHLSVSFFPLEKISAVYAVVNVVAIVWIERQRHTAEGNHSNELIIFLDNGKGPTVAVHHFHHGRPNRICFLNRYDTG